MTALYLTTLEAHWHFVGRGIHFIIWGANDFPIFDNNECPVALFFKWSNLSSGVPMTAQSWKILETHWHSIGSSIQFIQLCANRCLIFDNIGRRLPCNAVKKSCVQFIQWCVETARNWKALEAHWHFIGSYPNYLVGCNKLPNLIQYLEFH